MISGGDFLKVGVGLFAADAVDEGAEFGGVNEERVFAAVVEAAFGVGVFVFREEPEADENLRAVEELDGEAGDELQRMKFEFRSGSAFASRQSLVSDGDAALA